MSNIPSFVIHLERARERRANVDALFASLPGAATVIDAVDGQRLTDEQRARYVRRAHAPAYPFALSDSEVACFLSHRKAWQAIADGDNAYGMVFEDDVTDLDPRLVEILDGATRQVGPDCYVRLLHRRARDESGTLVAAAGDWSLIQPRPVGLCAAAQLIGRDAARKLLDWTARFDRPVDVALQLTWLHHVPIRTVSPGLFDMVGATTLAQRRLSTWDRLYHEIARPLYRMRIAARS